MPAPTSPTQPSPLLPSVFSHNNEPLAHPSPQAPDPDVPPTSAEVLSSEPPPGNNEDTIDDGDDEGLPYPDVINQPLWAPPHFTPYFALVEDAATGEYHHPAVHYVFSDDDPEITTSAVIEALEQAHEDRIGSFQAAEDPAPRERIILVDLAQDGQSIAAARSLTPDWAITSTSIRAAPTFGGEGDTEGEDEASGGYMLRIEGTGLAGSAAQGKQGKRNAEVRASKILDEAKSRGGGDLLGGLEEVLRSLEAGMEVLKKVASEE